jgi:hypothetical protein
MEIIGWMILVFGFVTGNFILMFVGLIMIICGD